MIAVYYTTMSIILFWFTVYRYRRRRKNENLFSNLLRVCRPVIVCYILQQRRYNYNRPRSSDDFYYYRYLLLAYCTFINILFSSFLLLGTYHVVYYVYYLLYSTSVVVRPSECDCTADDGRSSLPSSWHEQTHAIATHKRVHKFRRVFAWIVKIPQMAQHKNNIIYARDGRDACKQYIDCDDSQSIIIIRIVDRCRQYYIEIAEWVLKTPTTVICLYLVYLLYIKSLWQKWFNVCSAQTIWRLIFVHRSQDFFWAVFIILDFKIVYKLIV